MKPVIREYLASLRERGELDAILPDLLSGLGYTVISRPSRGTRQFGVTWPIGPPGDERVYLFSIKRGDLTAPSGTGTATRRSGSRSMRYSTRIYRTTFRPSTPESVSSSAHALAARWSSRRRILQWLHENETDR